MKGLIELLLLLLVLETPLQVWSFSAIHHGTASSHTTTMTTTTRTRLDAKSRRSFIGESAAAAVLACGVCLLPSFAFANDIPMITSVQFDVLLRESARSIKQVEFSGPKSETVTVLLMDGTKFGIKNVIESSVDPRSPLKIAAVCRENLVPTRFVDFEAALAAAPKKKKLYANERVLEAAEKEKEKKARMQQDEEDRIAALFKMEQEQAIRK